MLPANRAVPLAAVACGIVIAVHVFAAEPSAVQAPQTPPVRTAQQQFKNVQVLRDIPANQMIPTMHLITGQLGVGCQFCHVWEQWDREDKPQKQIARRMMLMTANLNRSSFAGREAVTCYTCHRGEAKPPIMVRLPVPTPPPHDAPEPRMPVLPSVDDVLAKYVRALGGEQALRKVKSRAIVGTRDVPTGAGGLVPVTAAVEIYHKAPNLLVHINKAKTFTVSEGFDGTAAWAQTVAGAVSTLPPPDDERTRRRANLYEPLELKSSYEQMDVTGIEIIGTRQAYVVTAVPERDTPERLYFDVDTGLLLRRAVFMNTAAGPSPFEVDFEDYRDADGVKVPFLVRMTPASQRAELGTRSTLRIQRVRTNVEIPDSRFVRPQPLPRTAR
jgi:hypothetical protein